MSEWKDIIYDIETDGLYMDTTKIHCMSLIDAQTGELRSFTDNSPKYEDISVGLSVLSNATKLIGHNIIGFDNRVLNKLTGFKPPKPELTFDTLVVSRLLFNPMMIYDYMPQNASIDMGNLTGSHSLKAWGRRLECEKVEFAEDGNWSTWSEEMQEYCEQDTRVSQALYNFLKELPMSPLSYNIESVLAEYISIQESSGIPFNEESAINLLQKLGPSRNELLNELQTLFPMKVKFSKAKVSSTNRGRIGDKKSTLFTRPKGTTYYEVTYEDFNPASPKQIKERLKEKYNWQPSIIKKRKEVDGEKQTVFEEEGTSEQVLSGLPYPGVQKIIDYKNINKIMGFLSGSGKSSWLSHLRDGRIHGSVNSMGTRTRRCTHSSPNLSQVPSSRRPYGSECRELFYAPKGWKFVGVDAKGLELRVMGHYLAKYDGGSYAKQVVEGDIHSHNQHMAGLETRNMAKTFIYAMLYGAGAEKIGVTAAPDADPNMWKSIGQQKIDMFMDNTPGYRELKFDVESEAKRTGFVTTIDGGKIMVTSGHTALNSLFQSAGSIIVKLWINRFYRKFAEEFGLPSWDGMWTPCLYSHDDAVPAIRDRIIKIAGDIMSREMVEAGKFLNLNVPMEADVLVGQNWAEAH